MNGFTLETGKKYIYICCVGPNVSSPQELSICKSYATFLKNEDGAI